MTALRSLRSLRALIAAQLALVGVMGAVTAFSFGQLTHDERAHFAYVESIAERFEIPEVGRDLISPEIAAISDGTYPNPSRVAPPRRGLSGQSYEGMQPPLYYVLAAPAFELGGGDHVTKLRLVRLFDLALLLITAWLLWRLARRLAGDDEDPKGLYALGLTVLLWPGVVVRAVTISNAVLEMLVGVLLALVAWDAWEKRDPRRLLLLGLVLGAGLLTRLTLVAFVPLLVVVAIALLRTRTFSGRRRGAIAAASVAIPAILLAPWIAANLHVYDALTAESATRRIQEPVLNPTGRTFGFGDVVDGFRALSRGVLPEEWWVKFLSEPWRIAFYLLGGALIVVVVAGLTRVEPPRAGRLAALGLLPVASGLVWMIYTIYGENWQLMLPRYLYPELLVLGVVAAVAVHRLVGARRAAYAAAGLSAAWGVLWLYLATSVTPFTG